MFIQLTSWDRTYYNENGKQGDKFYINISHIVRFYDRKREIPAAFSKSWENKKTTQVTGEVVDIHNKYHEVKETSYEIEGLIKCG